MSFTKRKIYIIALVFIFVLGSPNNTPLNLYVAQAQTNEPPPPPVDHSARDAYWALRHGPITAAQYQQAVRQSRQLPQALQLPATNNVGSQQTNARVASNAWSSIGPAPMFASFDGGFYSGRIAALAIDPTTSGNSTIIYIGTANGGVWKSINNGNSWIPLTDSQSTLASGAIVIDPKDHNTIYVGTGEPNQSSDSYKGSGVLKSTDAGSTWSLLGSAVFGIYNSAISRIIIDPKTENVFVASTIGLFMSLDGGTSWSSPIGVPTGVGVIVDDLAIDSGTISNSTLYATIRSNGLYRSQDGGKTWTTSSANGLPAGNVWNRSVMAVAPRPTSAIAQQYGELPLSFISNAGQEDPAVRFQIREQHGTLSFTSDGITLNLPTVPPEQNQVAKVRSGPASLVVSDSKAPTQVGIRLVFENKSPNASIEGTAQLSGIANFFIGKDSSKWHTNVPTYANVVYHNLYSGIDLSYTGHVGLLKGTYTLGANSDPTVIRWRYKDANSVKLDTTTGDLLISASNGVTLTEKAPIAWQEHNGTQVPVTVGYMLTADGTAQFAMGDYDHTLPLVIDPGLAYSTYLNSTQYGWGIAVDNSGSAYVTGATASTDFATGGAYQTTFGGGYDAFVAKLNAAGSALVYATYLGGSNSDFGEGVAVDSSGSAYVTGNTGSANFPTTAGAYQTIYGGGVADLFVAKLNATGSALVYATYLGGSGDDGNNPYFHEGIAVDNNGSAYVTSGTNSANFPTTAGAYQMVFGGGVGIGDDAFVVKLNAAGSALIYATYLGGSSDDASVGIAVDSNGNAYVTGSTQSANFPTTAGAYQTILRGMSDAFVVKLNAAGSGLVYATYLGGSSDDGSYGIAVDSSGNAYVTGSTSSTDFPTTVGAYKTALSWGGDAFVVKLNAAGNALVYATYLGTSGKSLGIAVNSTGNAYVTGITTLTNFATTVGAYQTTYGGDADAFMIKLNTTGSAFAYATYLGGSGGDVGYGIAVDSSGSR